MTDIRELTHDEFIRAIDLNNNLIDQVHILEDALRDIMERGHLGKWLHWHIAIEALREAGLEPPPDDPLATR